MNFRETIIYRWISIFLTWFGNIMIRISPSDVRAKDIRELLKLVKPGDVIMRRFDCYLDSYFIKGNYTHAGFYIGHNEIAHMMAEGKRIDDIIDFVKDADGFCILRPFYKRDIMDAVVWAKHVKCDYDFIFNTSRNDRFYYCFEFCYYAMNIGEVFPKVENDNIILASDLISSGEIIMEV